MDRLVVSGISGSVSSACWIIVFTPQIYENWQRQSTEGSSLAFVVIWSLGDIFNVFGALLQHVLPTMIVLAVYYTVADIVSLFQCLIYKKNRPLSIPPATHSRRRDAENQPLSSSPSPDSPISPISLASSSPRRKLERLFHEPAVKNALIVSTVVLCGILGYFMGDHEKPQDPTEPQPLNFWGQVLGWICAALYLASRLPQIHLNYKRKSTDGVAVSFFIFTLSGNITYCSSIFAADSSKHAMLLNASWIVGALGSLTLDIVVMAQFWIYRQKA